MNTTTTVYLSKQGMKELRKRVHQLEHDQARALNELRELDKSEKRDERMALIEKLASLETIETDLLDKKQLLSEAKQLPRKRDALRVALGSVVELIDQQGRLMRYTIVDSIEANPSDGRISILSPLGQSLIGKTAQQTIEWTTKRFQTNQLQLIRIM
ncbi:MAG: greA [Candidatus Saccharibacteria bacterium]|nr:greA [Candidatus Saccharibacteria bacterium]